jgi:hypothetical protein
MEIAQEAWLNFVARDRKMNLKIECCREPISMKPKHGSQFRPKLREKPLAEFHLVVWLS